MPAPSPSRSAMLFRSLCGDFDMVGIFTENPIKEGSLACIVSTSTSVCMERGRGAPSQLSAGAQPLQIEDTSGKLKTGSLTKDSGIMRCFTF